MKDRADKPVAKGPQPQQALTVTRCVCDTDMTRRTVTYIGEQH